MKQFEVAVKRVGLALSVGLLLVASKGQAGILDASWTAPTEHTDGSPLTDLASYRRYYGTSDSPCPGPAFVELASPTPSPVAGDTMSVQLTGLAPSTRYFVAVSAVDTAGSEGACSMSANAVARDEGTGNVPSQAMTEQAMSPSEQPSPSDGFGAPPEWTPDAMAAPPAGGDGICADGCELDRR